MIRYQIPNENNVKLGIYDLYGREVSNLVNKKQAAGIYTLNFSGDKLTSGYYFCKLTVGTQTKTTRLVKIE
jgi:hypothetical protein